MDTRIAMRLSSPLTLEPLSTSPLSLVGPAGAVSGTFTVAESGRLLFFKPTIDLLPGATYTAFLQGAKDRFQRSFPFSATTFTTRSFDNDGGHSQPIATPRAAGSGPSVPMTSTFIPNPKAVQTQKTAAAAAAPKPAAVQPKPEEPAAAENAEPEDWIPQEQNRHGNWRVLGLKGDPVIRVQGPASTLKAPSGTTAVAGQVLRYNGKPLANVAVSIGGHTTQSDSSGRFLVAGLTPGVTQLVVDGTGVLNNGRHYTKHFIRVELKKGETTAITDPIYLPRVNPATEVNVSSPASKELVLTHPAIPGLEVHIPKGAVLREYDGKIVTNLSITPIPLDRAPYPAPRAFSIYFTLQPGGAYIDGSAGKAIRVIYPNYPGLPPGARANFWNYDPAMGWQVYGQGSVSADGKQVVPDANVGFRQSISFGMSLSPADQPPAMHPPVNGCVQGGDPVDCATGLFLHSVTDLTVKDTIPISITRTYRQNDNVSRAFGIGTNLSYSMVLYSAITTIDGVAPPEVDLILSDGSRVAYLLQSGSSLGQGAWVHAGSPSIYYGSVLAAYHNSSGEGYTLTLSDKTVMKFASDVPNELLSITDRNGNSLTFSGGKNISRITSTNGRYVQLSYDAQSRIIQAADNLGRVVQYSYDGVGRLSSVTDADNHTESYAYDSSNRMTTVTDKHDNVAHMRIGISISGLPQLSKVLSRIAQLPNIISAKRRK